MFQVFKTSLIFLQSVQGDIIHVKHYEPSLKIDLTHVTNQIFIIIQIQNVHSQRQWCKLKSININE